MKNNKVINKICNHKYLFIFGILVLTSFITCVYAVILENSVRVNENSALTYYLDISYDGIDKYGVESTDTVVANVRSDYLYVEDKIPEGLIFNGFVTTENGTIGARQPDGSYCSGSVIDDTNESVVDTGVWNDSKTEYTYHGLHYNALNGTVSFKVKDLRAGCKLTVGIKTITPTVDDPNTTVKEIRRDFYNYATVRENDMVNKSNTVHAYIGKDIVTLYDVNYEYTGDIPDNAPSVPTVTSYMAGTNVGVSPNVDILGYEFSGWTTDDVVVNDGVFVMPESNVTLKGSFTKIASNKVIYTIDGDMPDNYVLPISKDYYPDTIVNVDVLEKGTVIGDYRFLGWETTDVVVDSDGKFTMPNKDVNFVGKFEEVKYNVIYDFYDGVLPPNYKNYLPTTKSYRPGETVRLEDIVSEPQGYKFLGWYYEDEFIMPDKDITIYGEWMIFNGEFEPTITKSIVSEKDYYRLGDDVKFKITVTNTSNFAIKNVIVKEILEGSKFIEGENYAVESDKYASIDTINALSSVDLYATYRVRKEDSGTIVNDVLLTSATADNGYLLKDKEYKASTSFDLQSKLKVCKGIDGVYVPNTFQFLITGISNKYETWVTLEQDECETVYLDPETYNIKEIIPQEYEISEVSGSIINDDSNFVVELGKNYEINYVNKFIKKRYLHSYGRVVNQIKQGGN